MMEVLRLDKGLTILSLLSQLLPVLSSLPPEPVHLTFSGEILPVSCLRALLVFKRLKRRPRSPTSLFTKFIQSPIFRPVAHSLSHTESGAFKSYAFRGSSSGQLAYLSGTMPCSPNTPPLFFVFQKCTDFSSAEIALLNLIPWLCGYIHFVHPFYVFL